MNSFFLKKIASQEHLTIAFLVVITLVLRSYYLAVSAWHDDAFNFIDKAVTLVVNGHYLNAHSTGYPLWLAFLALGLKIGQLLTGQWQVIFIPNLISAIFGTLIVYPLYYLLKLFYQKRILAWLGTFFIIFNPILWRWSEVAMGDVLALTLALISLIYALHYFKAFVKMQLYLATLFFCLVLLVRPIYVLIFIPILIYGVLSKPRNKKNILLFIVHFLAGGILALLCYFLINDFSLNILFNNYGAVMPSLEDIAHTFGILFKSWGIFFILPFLFSLYFLYREKRGEFYTILSLIIIFTLYIASWYQKGSFDIERYSLISLIFLNIAVFYLVTKSFYYQFIFWAAFILQIIFMFWGLARPVNYYSTYGTTPNWWLEPKIKYAQISSQLQTDADWQTYIALQEQLEAGSTVFYWRNDWSMPQLAFDGDQLTKKMILVGVESDDDLKNKIEQYKKQGSIYLIRGVNTAYEAFERRLYPINSLLLKNGAVIYYIPKILGKTNEKN